MSTICPGGPRLDTGDLRQLVEDADGEGIRNVRTLTDRWDAGTEQFDRVGERVLVAVAGATVIGVVYLRLRQEVARLARLT